MRSTQRLSRRKRLIFKLILATVASLATVTTLEVAARYYAYKIAQQGKRYTYDSNLGWRFVPLADRPRRSSAGNEYRFVTNANGFRVATGDAKNDLFRRGASRRVLILGDSFSEGEGVSADKRFDYIMENEKPSWSIRAVGCGGYATDQQLILLQGLFGELQPGDVVILLTCSNDLSDILRKTHSARAKPWCEVVDEQLVVHQPKAGLKFRLRDTSYLLGFLMGRLNSEATPSAHGVGKNAGLLYTAIVREMQREAAAAELDFGVAYHTGNGVGFPEDGRVFQDLESQGVAILNLDTVIGTAQSDPLNFLPCRHWMETGNAVAAEALTSFVADRF